MRTRVRYVNGNKVTTLGYKVLYQPRGQMAFRAYVTAFDTRKEAARFAGNKAAVDGWLEWKIVPVLNPCCLA
jgi:hypothetical protein